MVGRVGGERRGGRPFRRRLRRVVRRFDQLRRARPTDAPRASRRQASADAGDGRRVRARVERDDQQGRRFAPAHGPSRRRGGRGARRRLRARAASIVLLVDRERFDGSWPGFAEAGSPVRTRSAERGTVRVVKNRLAPVGFARSFSMASQASESRDSRPYAVVDVGSNTARLAVFEVTAAGRSPRGVRVEGGPAARRGDGADRSLSDEAMRRGLEALARFRRRLATAGRSARRSPSRRARCGTPRTAPSSSPGSARRPGSTCGSSPARRRRGMPTSGSRAPGTSTPIPSSTWAAVPSKRSAPGAAFSSPPGAARSGPSG